MNTYPHKLEVRFTGPPLEEGPLSTLFYFALSAEASLKQDPFNQPVQFLEGTPMRIFSVTLPAHENGRPPEEAIDAWKKEDLITPFIQELAGLVEELKPSMTTCFAAGLSRGVFIACHLAALCPIISHVLGFAPMTRLEGLDLETLVPKIYDRKIRFYMGNRDLRTGTEHTFSLVQKLAEEAYHYRIRSSPIEMIIGPSIGYQGHGTSPEVFKAGINWIKYEL
ncbi:hypothetical protein [Candidatus Neptunochlamydia vexilliferae]|uniref:hypothetical protein n=1 Tax=Candidatus Neptunichlamydia vexilliferae TaxID=1651774 RepID=UPI00189119C0|nr:hypothetical protein [Candidatus Neptunochlamydia vexilliferae]